MTTPERLRRRQRIETALFVIVGILVIVLSIHDARERDADKAQFEACLVDQFAKSSEAQIARGDIAEMQSEAVAKVIEGVGAALAANDYAEIQRVLEAFSADQATIDRLRTENPYPPFPEGKCES